MAIIHRLYIWNEWYGLIPKKNDNEEIGNGALLQDMWENTIQ